MSRAEWGIFKISRRYSPSKIQIQIQMFHLIHDIYQYPSIISSPLRGGPRWVQNKIFRDPVQLKHLFTPSNPLYIPVRSGSGPCEIIIEDYSVVIIRGIGMRMIFDDNTDREVLIERLSIFLPETGPPG
jgi:hypothetical protein